MTKTPDNQLDDFEAVRAVVNAIEKFPRDDQHRILRWAQEKLGITTAPAAPYTPPATPSAPASGAAAPAGIGTPSASTDIRSFLTRKKPSSDNQLTAAIAYYYRFEAPPSSRKEVIRSEDLKEAARAIGQGGRFSRAAQTLVNAHKQGLLNRASEGGYTLSDVGENLVAVTLGADGSEGGTTIAPRKKTRRAGNGAKKKASKKPRR